MIEVVDVRKRSDAIYVGPALEAEQLPASPLAYPGPGRADQHRYLVWLRVQAAVHVLNPGNKAGVELERLANKYRREGKLVLGYAADEHRYQAELVAQFIHVLSREAEIPGNTEGSQP